MRRPRQLKGDRCDRAFRGVCGAIPLLHLKNPRILRKSAATRVARQGSVLAHVCNHGRDSASEKTPFCSDPFSRSGERSSEKVAGEFLGKSWEGSFKKGWGSLTPSQHCNPARLLERRFLSSKTKGPGEQGAAGYFPKILLLKRAEKVLCPFHRSHREICTRNRLISETKFLDDFWGPLSLPAPLVYC